MRNQYKIQETEDHQCILYAMYHLTEVDQGFRKKAGHSMDKIPLEGWQQFRFLYKWRYREYLDCEVEYC